MLLRAAAARGIPAAMAMPFDKLPRSALITVLNDARVDFDEQAPIEALRNKVRSLVRREPSLKDTADADDDKSTPASVSMPTDKRKKARSLVRRRPSLKDAANMNDGKSIPASMSMPINKLSRSALITILNNAKVHFDVQAPIEALRKKVRSLVRHGLSLKETANVDDGKRLLASMSVPIDKLPRAELITVLHNAKEVFDAQASIDVLRKRVKELVRRGPTENKFKKNTASSRLITCACTTPECLATNKTNCTSEYNCYVQYLLKTDDSDSITRGCVVEPTPLLCENRQPTKVSHNKWPYLMCCDQDLCNEGPVNMTSLSLKQANQPQQRSRTVITAGADVPQQWVFNAGSATSQGFVIQGISKVIVLTVLFLGLLLLVCIMAYGFHLIREQSSYIRRVCLRAASGDRGPLMKTPPQRSQAPPDQQTSHTEEQEPSIDLDLPPALPPGVPGPSGISMPCGKAAVRPSCGFDNRRPPHRSTDACLLHRQVDACLPCGLTNDRPPCGQTNDNLPRGKGNARPKRGKANASLSHLQAETRPSRKVSINQFPESMILE